MIFIFWIAYQRGIVEVLLKLCYAYRTGNKSQPTLLSICLRPSNVTLACQQVPRNNINHRLKIFVQLQRFLFVKKNNTFGDSALSQINVILMAMVNGRLYILAVVRVFLCLILRANLPTSYTANATSSECDIQNQQILDDTNSLTKFGFICIKL